MGNKIASIRKEIESLNDISRTVRAAHFAAAQAKVWKHRILGVGVILLNIMIFSPLFDIVAPKNSPTIIKFLAIIAASLAGIQTLFTFQKEAETHLNAGDAYGSINRKIKLLLAEHTDDVKDGVQITAEFKQLLQEYLQINKDYKGTIPSEREYDKGRDVLRQLDEKRKTTASPTKDSSEPNSAGQ